MGIYAIQMTFTTNVTFCLQPQDFLQHCLHSVVINLKAIKLSCMPVKKYQ